MLGQETVDELAKTSQFIQLTQASLTENHPHDLFITNPGELRLMNLKKFHR